MDTKYLSELPDTIDKLLKSTNIDDVVLGVILTKEKMGTQWIKDNFIYYNYPEDKEKSPFPTNLRDLMEEPVLKFKDVWVLIGGIALEALKPGSKQYNANLKEAIYEE